MKTFAGWLSAQQPRTDSVGALARAVGVYPLSGQEKILQAVHNPPALGDPLWNTIIRGPHAAMLTAWHEWVREGTTERMKTITDEQYPCGLAREFDFGEAQVFVYVDQPTSDNAQNIAALLQAESALALHRALLARQDQLNASLQTLTKQQTRESK